jgi:hypothetical protein
MSLVAADRDETESRGCWSAFCHQSLSGAADLSSEPLPVLVRLGIDPVRSEEAWLADKIAKYVAEVAELFSVEEEAVYHHLSILLRAPLLTGDMDQPEAVTAWRRQCERMRNLRSELEAIEASYSRLMSIAPKEVNEDGTGREVRQYQKLYQSIARLRADCATARRKVEAAEEEVREHEANVIEVPSNGGPGYVPRIRFSHLYYLSIHKRAVAVRNTHRWGWHLVACCLPTKPVAPTEIELTPRVTAEDAENIGL